MKHHRNGNGKRSKNGHENGAKSPAEPAKKEPKEPPLTTKIFVVDTSVIIHDGAAIESFDKHEVAIPSVVLEEIDDFKKAQGEPGQQAREFIRCLNVLAKTTGASLLRGIPIGPDKGKIRVVHEPPHGKGNGRYGGPDAFKKFPSKKNDNHILNITLAEVEKHPGRQVVLVTKDMNLRLKAQSLGLHAEDYEAKSVKKPEQLYTGVATLDLANASFIDDLNAEKVLPAAGVLDRMPKANQFFLLKNHSMSCLARFNARTEQLERISKRTAVGITPRNLEQTFALDAVMDDRIKLVTIIGKAGTGKTLLALAGALEQLHMFRMILLARPIVPLSNRDIGYLPGDIKSKVNPYMEPLWDNLAAIKDSLRESRPAAKQREPDEPPQNSKKKTKGSKRKGMAGNGPKELVEIEKAQLEERLQIIPLAYIRGRSFVRTMLIVDEAQNLTPHEVKTIITRAGRGTKVVFTGDIFQIDTPYLDAHSNGLTYLIDRCAGRPLYAHVNLEKGERSDLAEMAATLL